MNKILILVVAVFVAVISYELYKKQNRQECQQPAPQTEAVTTPPNQPTPPILPPSPVPGKIYNYTDGLQLSKNSGKPMLIVFGAEKRCPWCRKLDQTLASPEVQKSLAGYVNVRVDVDKEKEIAMKYHMTGKVIPNYAIVDSNEKVVRAGKGYRTPAQFQRWLNSNLNED